MTRVAAVALALALGAAACVDTTTLDDYPCPPGGTQLTYASFGAAFLDSYCQRCHATAAGERHGAPAAYAFDDLAQVRRHASRVFARSAADNTTMPPGPDDPPAAERERLAQWLACGAP
jgi:uncharacterized membrane protein